MTAIYVDESIEIQALPPRVWEVLTSPEWTSQWSGYFGAAGPVESDWRPGSEVRWRNSKGDVYVQGVVKVAEPGKLLQYTVRDVFDPKMRPVSGLPEDDVTQRYSLTGSGARTVLSVSHGDFSKLADGAKLRPLVVQLWNRVLPKLKELAESAGR